MTLARALFVAATGVAVRRWHTGWGATETERGEQLPGDEYPVGRSGMRATRALTIDATPEQVWPWILPQWQEVAVGDPAAPMNPLQPVEQSPWRVGRLASRRSHSHLSPPRE